MLLGTHRCTPVALPCNGIAFSIQQNPMLPGTHAGIHTSSTALQGQKQSASVKTRGCRAHTHTQASTQAYTQVAQPCKGKSNQHRAKPYAPKHTRGTALQGQKLMIGIQVRPNAPIPKPSPQKAGVATCRATLVHFSNGNWHCPLVTHCYPQSDLLPSQLAPRGAPKRMFV